MHKKIKINGNIEDVYIDHWQKLDFDSEKHAYNVLGAPMIPVSNKVKKLHKPFNKQLAHYVALSRTKKTGKKWNKSMVLKEWREKAKKAAETGTRVHDFLEDFVRDICFDNADLGIERMPGHEPTCDQERVGVMFWRELDLEKYVPVALEQRMYLEDYGFAGTADVILYNNDTGKFVIVDYKTNEKLFKDYGNYMKEPFTDMIENNFNKYALQFAHYQLMFEAVGYEVEDRWLVWLRPDDEGNQYQVLQVPYLTDKLKEYYESKNSRGSHIYFT